MSDNATEPGFTRFYSTKRIKQLVTKAQCFIRKYQKRDLAQSIKRLQQKIGDLFPDITNVPGG